MSKRFQLSIPAKLIITVLVPMSLLVYLSFDKVDRSKERLRDLELIKNKTNEIEYISGVLHEIQKERDFAALYLMDASTEAQIKFQNQIKETDSTLLVFRNQITENKSDTTVFSFSQELKTYRGQISWFQLSYDDAFYYYNRILEQYLGQISLMGAGSKIPETRTEINAYISLLWTKEYLGRVRTVLNGVFTNGKLNSMEEYGLFATYKGGFESSLQNFQKIAAQEVKDEFNMDFQMTGYRMLETVDFVFENPEIERFPYEADGWWFSATSAINVLHNVELSSIYRIQNIVNNNIEITQRSIDKIFLVLSGSVSIAFLLSFLLIRSLTKQVNAIRNSAMQIAEGNNEVLIENTSNDAIGSLARSFNNMAENAQKLAKTAESIGSGNYDVEVPIRSENDQLGNAINQMKINLNKQTLELIEKAKELQIQNDQIQEQQKVLEKNNEELAQSNKYKSAFLANMSHELRTPLNSLIILAKVLGSNEEGNLSEDQMDSLRVIAKSGDNLLELINDILDISKIEAGRLDLNIQEVSLKTIANDMKELFDPVAKQNEIDFHINYHIPQNSTIQTDALRLGQVLKNLLSNAFKFTPSKGQVDLIFEDKYGSLSISVKDNGIGIPKDKHESIFEAFKQVDGSISRNYGGTGLGLSICSQLCDLLNAQVFVESEEGKGSVFTILLDAKLSEFDSELVESELFKPTESAIERNNIEERESSNTEEWIINDLETADFNFNGREVIFLESDITRVFALSAILNPFQLGCSEVESIDELKEKLSKTNPFCIVVSLKDIDLYLDEVYQLFEEITSEVIVIAPSIEPKRPFPRPVHWLNETVNASRLLQILKKAHV